MSTWSAILRSKFGPSLLAGNYYDLPPTHKAMAGQAADFCPIILCVTAQDATGIAGRPVGQISPDKSMNFHYTTPAFTVAPELRALRCCARLPRASALYSVSVRGLIVSESRCARLPALGLVPLRGQAVASTVLLRGYALAVG